MSKCSESQIMRIKGAGAEGRDQLVKRLTPCQASANLVYSFQIFLASRLLTGRRASLAVVEWGRTSQRAGNTKIWGQVEGTALVKFDPLRWPGQRLTFLALG
jgi:hypothetical protein